MTIYAGIDHKLCSVDGCDRYSRARGWCSRHYDRWKYRGGDPSVSLTPTRGLPLADRFWRFVDRSDAEGCWPFRGGRDRDGYGSFQVSIRKLGLRRHFPAHFIAYLLTHNLPLSSKFWVCHTCDNPPCCNPAHLWKGDARSNNGDRARKGRSNPLRGSAHPNAKLTEERVAEIRERRLQGETQHSLALTFGVSRGHIWRIIHGRRW